MLSLWTIVGHTTKKKDLQERVPLFKFPKGAELSLYTLRRICLKLESYVYGLQAKCRAPVKVDVLAADPSLMLDTAAFDENLQLPFAGPVSTDAGKPSFLMCNVQAEVPDVGEVTVPIYMNTESCKGPGKGMVPAFVARSSPKPNMAVHYVSYSVDLKDELLLSASAGAAPMEFKVPVLIPSETLDAAVAAAPTHMIELLAPVLSSATARRGKKDKDTPTNSSVQALPLNLSLGPTAYIQQKQSAFEHAGGDKKKNKRTALNADVAHLLG
jgi:hypothetical protein